MNRPWWRQQNGHWYVRHNGTKKRLSQEPDPDGGGRKHPPPAVETAWHALLAGREPEEPAGLTVREGIALFNAAREGKVPNGTGWCLRQFERHVGPSLPASDLRPYHLTDLFRKRKGWGDSTRRT